MLASLEIQLDKRTREGLISWVGVPLTLGFLLTQTFHAHFHLHQPGALRAQERVCAPLSALVEEQRIEGPREGALGWELCTGSASSSALTLSCFSPQKDYW